MNIIVQRAPGDKQGDDISDTLLTTVPVALARGMAEIDKTFSNRAIVTMTGPLSEYIEWGSVVEVMDSQQQIWRGMVTATEISFGMGQEGMSCDITLTIEREYDG